MTTSFQFRDRSYELDSRGKLTEKEEVETTAILLGLTYKESAKQRGVSPETAKTQRASAKAKVGASSLPEFVMTVVNNGWLRDFLLGVLRRAARKARTQRLMNPFQAPTRRRTNGQWLSPTEPLFCHATRVDYPFTQLTAAQQAHVQRLSCDNAVRYLAFLAAREVAL